MKQSRKRDEQRAREADVIGSAGRTSPADSGRLFERAAASVERQIASSDVASVRRAEMSTPPDVANRQWWCAVCGNNNCHLRTTCRYCGAMKDVETSSDVDVFRSRVPESFEHHAPHAPGSVTSRDAAAVASGKLQTVMERTHEHIKANGQRGRTREEIATELSMRLGTVCSAVRVLYLRGRIGSNCVNGCNSLCTHRPVSRPGETGQPNEVLVDERYVSRWTPEQTRETKR